MQSCNDTSLFRGLWNDRICLFLFLPSGEEELFPPSIPLQSPALFWLHVYNPRAARWTHSMAHYSLQYFFSVLVNSQGRSQNWKGLFVPRGQTHVITGAALRPAPSSYGLYSFPSREITKRMPACFFFFFFSHTALFIHFPRHPGNLELFICFEIWQIPRGNNSWQVVSHEIEAFFFPFSLISDSKIRHRVWVPGPLLCALSLSQSHQDFLIAYRRMRCE